MIVFSGSKINLHLQVKGKRKDGFHNIESLFYPIGYYDIVEIIKDNTSKNITLNTSGISFECEVKDNLVYKTAVFLQKTHSLGGIKIHLHKNIPMGAGLAGGSANVVATIDILNRLYDLNLSYAEKYDIALSMGSDCPFFINHKPSIVRGRGELIEEIPINLSHYFLALINPAIHISTAEAYRNINPSESHLDLKTLGQNPLSEWKNYFFNDFEPYAFKTYPVLKKIKEQLYTSGALYASMTGSGSSIYGLFKHKKNLNHVENHKVHWIAL